VPVFPLPGLLSGTALNSSLNAINESNWVVGTVADKSVLWRGGTAFEQIWVGSPRTTRGFGLNDAGMVVGEWVGSGGQALGFRWSEGAAPVLLPDPPVLWTGGDSEARDVDEDGNIVVYYWRNTSTSCPAAGNITDATAVLVPPYTSPGNYTLVPAPLCQTVVDGRAVDGGDVVGRFATPGSAPNEAFHWEGAGAAQLLGDWFPTDLEGQFISGRRFIGGVSMAVRSVYPAAPADLGTLGGASSDGRGVNGLGWVVGSSETGGGETHAFLWTPDDGMIDLGTLGGVSSTAAAVNDEGYIVGEARNAAGQRIPVIWFVDPAAEDDQPPVMDAIISQLVQVGQTLVVTPVVNDPEDDPFTLTWSGEVPTNATVNGSFTWTPTAEQVGDHSVTVTATQDDDPTLFDSETFVISVLPEEVPSANLQMTVGPGTPQQQLVGDAVAYVASVHNVGPDVVTAGLTVALEYRDQAEWGAVPPTAAINGVFFIEVGPIGAGETAHVPFEVVYGAFGVQAVTATLSGEYDEVDPDDNESVFEQVVDLAFDTPGVQTGGHDVPGTHTSDGIGLAIVGIRVPSALIAGDPGFDLFVPAELTPADLLPGGQAVVGGPFVAGGHFVPAGTFIGGDLTLVAGQPGAVIIPLVGEWLDGRVSVPAVNDWDPLGRILFVRGATDLLVGVRGGNTLTVEKGVGPGLAVGAAGGASDAALGLCAGGFEAHAGAGDAAELACGSLTTTVLTGEVTVVLADGTTVQVAAGAEVRITEDGAGGWDIEILAGAPEDVIVTPPETNEPPLASAGGPYVAAVGTSLMLDGTESTDPDGDALTYEWLLDDGSVGGIVASGATPMIAVPALPGLYLLTLTVDDSNAGASVATVEVAVYDPDGSSVTGGGWFDSPAGALVADPAAQGRANFAFHLEYRRGRSTPEGNARLSFNAGGLHLTSSSFDWLVVGGDMARFRGMGALEGRLDPVYFEVVARDPDGIRVRIWDDAGGIYDSTEVELGGGRVVIQG
jgi:probable HAF family extracellular repeat protein